MITIVFDDSNLQTDVVMYLDGTDVSIEGAATWRIWSKGNSLLSKLKGDSRSIMCSPVTSVSCNSGEFKTIYGLEELDILLYAQKASQGVLKNNELYKGTTFGGNSANPYSFMAMLLKQGLKNRTGGMQYDIHSGVKFSWEKVDLIQYINTINYTVNSPSNSPYIGQVGNTGFQARLLS